MAEETDADMLAQMILLAAAQHDLVKLKNLLRNGSANVQDPETGSTPLHAAIAACAPDIEDEDNKEAPPVNGHINGVSEAGSSQSSELLEGALKTVRLLLQNGAIWNDLDSSNETPGCIANRLGLEQLYDVMVDAGVRAEILLNRLDEYEPLEDVESEEEGEDGPDAEDNNERLGLDQDEPVVADTPAQDTSAQQDNFADDQREVNSEQFLQSHLTYHGDRLLDADKNGVMMTWEKDIMEKTAKLLTPKEGLRILNIGHGMGIIDELFQSQAPSTHHIVEAHPAVLARLRETGWYEKPNVLIHEGRWQDVVPKILEQDQSFDVIYFDTFAEDYKALRNFFSEYVIGLLDAQGIEGEGGRFGFFNGLGADRQVCYDVYTKVVEMDLFEAGFDTEWEEMTIPDLDETGEWAGVRRKYWALDKYKLPVCKFMG
ncbi:MAG: hypothetical protein M4579_000907 [Chaenotheca gracillima]|nr:MAG: hypothetical protein M4579_000907 [Chaenotheca gracillima]